MEAEFRSLRGWGIGMMEPDIRIIECMQIPEMETRIKSLRVHFFKNVVFSCQHWLIFAFFCPTKICRHSAPFCGTCFGIGARLKWAKQPEHHAGRILEYCSDGAQNLRARASRTPCRSFELSLAKSEFCSICSSEPSRKIGSSQILPKSESWNRMRR